MPTRLVRLAIDAADPVALARCWSAALGWSVAEQRAGEVVLAPPRDDLAQAGQLPLAFVRAEGPKVTKNRVHLDLASTSDEHQAALVSRLEGLGASRVDVGQPADVSWVVLADPEGNELCVVSRRGTVGDDPASTFGDLGPVAAVVVDGPGPDAVAALWSAATGWPALGRDGTHVWLRDPAARGPYLDLRRAPGPTGAEQRARLDVAPYPGDDHAAEVDRQVGLGARRVDRGRDDVPGVVLADPRATSWGCSSRADRQATRGVLRPRQFRCDSPTMRPVVSKWSLAQLGKSA